MSTTCTVSFTARGPMGDILPGFELSFRRAGASIAAVGSWTVARDIRRAVADGAGQGAIVLTGGRYMVSVPTSIGTQQVPIVVPSSGTADLWQLIEASDVPTPPASVVEAQFWAEQTIAAAARVTNTFFPTRAEAMAATLPVVQQTLCYVEAGILVEFVRAAGGTALVLSDGSTWMPAGDYSPLHWGAKGNGAGNDGVAFNAALAAFKVAVESSIGAAKPVTLTGFNRSYRTTVSLNVTGITGWKWAIQDMQIIGACTGKCVFDQIGSRGGAFSKISIFGDAANRPSVLWQCARGPDGPDGFASSSYYENIFLDGWYTDHGFFGFGFEACSFNSFTVWVRTQTARGFTAVGRDFTMTSDYMTPITGETSFILNQYNDIEVRYIPVGKTAVVTGISQAASAVVTTSAAHPYVNGEPITLSQLTGVAKDFNGLMGVVTVISPTSFSLSGADTTAMASAYVGTGFAALASNVAPVLFNRGAQHLFKMLYVVAYGTPAVEWDMTSSVQCNEIEFNALVEGAPTNYISFTGISGDRSVAGLKFSNYNMLASVSAFTASNNAGPSLLSIFNSEISIQNYAYAAKPLWTNGTFVRMLGGSVYTPLQSGFVPLTGYIGDQFAADMSKRKYYNAELDSPVLNRPELWQGGVQRWRLSGGNGSIVPNANLACAVGDTTLRVTSFIGRSLNLGVTSTDGVTMTTGNASPEGVMTANVGSIFVNKLGSPGTIFYLKESGTGNTGWVAKW